MEQKTSDREKTDDLKLSDVAKKTRRLIAVGAIMLTATAVTCFIFLQTKEYPPELPTADDTNSFQSQNLAYGGPFYRKDGKVLASDPQNDFIKNLILPNADPDTFKYLQGFAGYDKDDFHYLRFDDAIKSYVPTSVAISSDIKKLFALAETSGKNIHIAWSSNTDVVFKNLALRRLSEYGDSNAFRIEIYEILNNEAAIGHLWVGALSKTNVVNNTLYLYIQPSTVDNQPAVYEVSYGNQPSKILDIDPDKTAFKPGASKMYYTTSYESLDFYEYDTVTKTERKIPIQYKSATTSSSRITLSPDEKHLLVQSNEENGKTRTLLVDIKTGSIEIVREKEVVGRGGDFPFAISPSTDKVYFLKTPYEGYLFGNPSYVQKDSRTGVWGSELTISSINTEVGGGWNITMGQWSLSPSGRYLAVADATEHSVYACDGFGDTPRAHNVIKIFDMETLETQTLVVKSPDENFTLNSWALDESGISATRRKVKMNPTQNCGEPSGEGTKEFYQR